MSKSPIRLAVVGGGTAGAMAAAHLAHAFPDADLAWYHDPGRPPIGVGEGTLPAFPRWLQRVTGLGFAELRERAGVTEKLGVRFEGWGKTKPIFRHSFGAGSLAFHVSAERLVPLLEIAVGVAPNPRPVRHLASDGRIARLLFADGGESLADLVLDARGFPAADEVDVVRIPWVPTGAAWLARGPRADWQGYTRAVARPHGWVFAIPLAWDAGYGYLFDPGLTAPEEAGEDFAAWLASEGVAPPAAPRLLRYPNFRRASFFDGALLRVGNAGSFLEPLEATAIGLLQHQLEVAALWLAGGVPGPDGAVTDRHAPAVVAAVDGEIARTVDRVALFVAWHYSAGSIHDTPFWRRAVERWQSAEAQLAGTRLLADFRRLRARSAALPAEAIEQVRDPRVFAQQVAPHLGDLGFGGFDAASFAQIGRGLGD